MLCDTGASISLASTRLIHALGKNSDIEPTNKLIAGLGKRIIPVRGQITLPIKLGKQQLQHTFIVCDNVDSCILAGLDLIKSFGMCIDVPRRQITMPSGTALPFIEKPLSLKSRMKIRCAKTFKIPANTACHIQGKIPICNPKHNYEGIIEPYCKLADNTGIFITGSLSYSKLNVFPVHCVNPSPWDVTIYKNQLIAFVEPFGKLENVEKVYRITGHSNFNDVMDDYDASMNHLPRLPNAKSVETTRAEGKWEDPQELIRQLEIDKIEIPDNYKEDLKKLVTEYSHCFSRNKYDLGCASFYEAQLHLKRDFVPKWVPTRPISYKMEPHLDREISNLENSGQISPCYYSLWNSCVFLTMKTNGSYRFVVDARALNSQTIRDNYQLPKINTILDKLTECRYWSNFDLTSSFTQIGLKEKSRPLTAFTSNGRRLMWNRLIQGQTNSSAEFSRCMTQLFSRVPFNCLLIYIDDLLLSSNSVHEHLRRLKFILQRLEWGFLKLSTSKTRFLQKSCKFLGNTLSEKGLQIDDSKIAGVAKLPAPNSRKQVQKFLGMVNWVRQFIPKFAQKAAPLYQLLRKDSAFNWTPECQASFEELRTAMTQAPILGLPDYSDQNQSYELTIDSSKLGHGACLTQFDGKERRIISYFSKSVPKHQQKLGATKLETLGLLAALKHYKIYLHATPFKVYTDCAALVNLHTIFSKENSYVQRRLAEIAGFHFTIHHINGDSEEMAISDYLSRYGQFSASTKNSGTQTTFESSPKKLVTTPTKLKETKNRIVAKSTKATKTVQTSDFEQSSHNSGADVNSSQSEDYDDSETDVSSPVTDGIEQVLLQTEENLTIPVTIDDVKNEYKNDKILLEVINWVKNNKKPDNINLRQCHVELAHYWKNFNLLSHENEILYFKKIDPNNRSNDVKAIVVPYTLIERVMFNFHNSKMNCHSGISNSIDQCGKKFYFYDMKKEFELWIAACLVCNKTKQTKAFKRAELRPIRYSHFGQAISLDHLEVSKTPTSRGNVALLTITDMFTSYLVCVPVKSTDSETTIKNLIEHWALKHGWPGHIHHDLASGFESKLFKAMMQVFGIKNKPGTSFHSQTQGKVESQNRRLNMCFRACLPDKDFRNYDLYVKYIVSTLNCLKSSRTNHSANFLTYGRELTMPRDLFIEDDRLEQLEAEENPTTIQGHAYALYKQVRDVTRKVVEHTKKRALYQSTQYNKRISGPFFEKGDYCFILVNVPRHKYSEKWQGPYRIIDRINDWNYILEVNGTNKIVNIQKMKEYRVNKYSKLPDKSTVSTSTEQLQLKGDKAVLGSSKRSDRRQLTRSDSSDDDEIIIEWADSLLNPQAQQTIGNNSGNNNAINSDIVQLPTGDTPNYAPVTRDLMSSNNDISTPQSPKSVTSDAQEGGDFSDASINEADQEARTSDHRPISLPEIDEHGKRKGIVRPSAAQRLSRSTAVDNLPVPHRSNQTYDLRPKPKPVSKFGMIAKGLKPKAKQASSSKTKKKD